jgi:hypothetical protein
MHWDCSFNVQHKSQSLKNRYKGLFDSMGNWQLNIDGFHVSRLSEPSTSRRTSAVETHITRQ